MPDRHGTVREVVWNDICPWLILVSTVRIAVSPRVLLLAAAALLAVSAGTRGIGLALGQNDNPVIEQTQTQYGAWPWDLIARETRADTERQAAGPPPHDARLPSLPLVRRWLPVSLAGTIWQRMSDPFFRLFGFHRQELGIVGLAYLVLNILWALEVWALFGGAITRIAALALARNERIGARAAVVFSARKWRDFISAPLLPLCGVLPIIISLALLGLGLRFDPLVFVAGLVWPLVLLAGLLLAIILFGLLAGWPLLWPAISVERGDAFDAVSNCYAYVYQRPLHYIFYLLVASLVGVVGAAVVNLFTGGLLDLSAWAVSWGCGTARLQSLVGGDHAAESGWMLGGGTNLIQFWVGCLLTLQLAFYYAFFWTAATAIYLLLRRTVDAKEMDEVALDDESQTSGLAPLVGLETGVPEVADSP